MYSKTNWNQLWIAQQKASIGSGRGGGCPQAWEERAAAEKYWQNSQKGEAAHYRLNDLLGVVKPDWRILDIGAGPGNLAIPLAKQVNHVTAVEPAGGMVSILKEQLAVNGLQNVTVVKKWWDDVDISRDLQAPYHLALASYSLGMVDLRATIEKMVAVTTYQIIIYWHAGDQAWDKEAAVLWPLLHCKEHVPVPKSDLLFGVLCEMGIYPEVRVIHTSAQYTYPSIEAAVTEYALRYEIETNTQRQLLQKYLTETLAVTDGQFVQQQKKTGMRLSWLVG